MPLTLPSREGLRAAIHQGTEDDYALIDLYYSWYAGWFYRHRLRMVARMLGDGGLGHVLEVGSGSGIFLPELLKRAERVTGIDIHAEYDGIHRMLRAEGFDAERVHLQQGSIMAIPFEDAAFDHVVVISVMEHFADPYPPLREMARVVKPGGTVVMGFPAKNIVTRTLFAALGYEEEAIHPGDQHTIIPAAREVAAVDRVRMFPTRLMPLYTVCRMVI